MNKIFTDANVFVNWQKTVLIMRILFVFFGTKIRFLSFFSLFLSESSTKQMAATYQNPFQLPSDEEFLVGESDLAFFESCSERSQNGAVLICTKGRCEISVDNFHGTLRRNGTVLMLPGSLLSIRQRSADFKVSLFVFSPTLFSEAAFRLEIDFMRIIKNHPVAQQNAQTARTMHMWMSILEYTYQDRNNRFRNTIIKNRLQNALLELCDKVMRIPELITENPTQATMRQNEIFNRFMQLLHQHGGHEREVTFYAEQLCISTRYLSTIVRSVSGKSAKTLIDNVVLLELKLLLRTTDLSIQEIAYRLHFPDQSYLGRFFRKHTGISPTAFRSQNS